VVHAEVQRSLDISVRVGAGSAWLNWWERPQPKKASCLLWGAWLGQGQRRFSGGLRAPFWRPKALRHFIGGLAETTHREEGWGEVLAPGLLWVRLDARQGSAGMQFRVIINQALMGCRQGFS